MGERGESSPPSGHARSNFREGGYTFTHAYRCVEQSEDRGNVVMPGGEKSDAND